jgi:hypothetical protein
MLNTLRLRLGLRSGVTLVMLSLVTACGVTTAAEEAAPGAPAPSPTTPVPSTPDASTALVPDGETPPSNPSPSVPGCASQCAGKHPGASNVQGWTCNANNDCVVAACVASYRNCNGLVDDGCEESSSNGECAPIELQKPTGGGSIGWISTSDTEIYWMTSSNNVRHCPKAGCPSFAAYTVPFGATGFVAVGDDLFFSSYQGIMRCPGTGCTSPPTVFVAAEQALTVTAAAGTIYWGTTNGSVRSCPVAGCGANGPVQVAKGGYAHEISVANDFVAWGEFSQPLRVCPLAGCPTGPTKLPGTAYGYPGSVHIFDGNVYWAGGGNINVCPPTGCTTPTKLAPSGASFQVDETSIYYTKGDALERCPRTGCPATGPVKLTHGLPANAATLAQDDAMLYVAGYNTVFKVAK